MMGGGDTRGEPRDRGGTRAKAISGMGHVREAAVHATCVRKVVVHV